MLYSCFTQLQSPGRSPLYSCCTHALLLLYPCFARPLLFTLALLMFCSCFRCATCAYAAQCPGSSLLEWSQSLPDFQDDFAAFADAHHLSLLLVMLTFTDNTKAFNRQLVIYASDALLMQDCSVFLATSSFPSFQQLGVDPSLDLNKQDILESTPLFKGSRCIAWQQRNLKASRKQLQPAVEAFLQSKRA